MSFSLLAKSTKSAARRGKLTTAHGDVETPWFMPIGTAGSVKSLDSAALREMGAQMMLSNTYHLWQTPGLPVLERAGGLHAFISWPGAILTDSGGFQVFSLAKLRKLTDEGVRFSSHRDGAELFLSPSTAIEIQRIIGSDIMMVLDECPPAEASEEAVAAAVERTTKWATLAQEAMKKHPARYGREQLGFGIVQGGKFAHLRERSARELAPLEFDGYAIGGVSVGEDRALVREQISVTAPLLPEDKPRYLMGMGRPEEIVFAVEQGVDMFDCVIPTREARHGRLYEFCSPDDADATLLWDAVAYRTRNIFNEEFRLDMSEVVPGVSSAYLRHLFIIQDPLALRIATQSNVAFYLDLMSRIRAAIEQGIV